MIRMSPASTSAVPAKLTRKKQPVAKGKAEEVAVAPRLEAASAAKGAGKKLEIAPPKAVRIKTKRAKKGRVKRAPEVQERHAQEPTHNCRTCFGLTNSPAHVRIVHSLKGVCSASLSGFPVRLSI